MPQVKEFKVGSVSETTNSFGLRGMMLFSRDGEAWQVAANSLNVKKTGDIIKVPVHEDSYGNTEVDFTALSYEIPERLRDCPPQIVEDIWKQ